MFIQQNILSILFTQVIISEICESWYLSLFPVTGSLGDWESGEIGGIMPQEYTLAN